MCSSTYYSYDLLYQVYSAITCNNAYSVNVNRRELQDTQVLQESTYEDTILSLLIH